jgi:glycine/D-amino acid oxidase-like deaminating enzyme
MNRTFDIAVIGAGCFGAWSAHALRAAGHSVVLLDAWGAAHSRASSGGESRIIRCGYGKDELYTRWAQRSLPAWQALGERTRRTLFHPCGMLWMTRGGDDAYAQATLQTLQRVGVEHERLPADELARRFPQIATDGIEWALFEPQAGALMARQAVQALLGECVQAGVEYRRAQVVAPPAPRGLDSFGADRQVDGELDAVQLSTGEWIEAGAFVFACGPWLPKLFPDLLGARIFPTRQEVFFFAPPPGDGSFAPPAMPCWLQHPDLFYGIPDLENRGFKISLDRHGPAFDPDSGSRLPDAQLLATVRDYLGRRFPQLKGATLTESRVCQYENTSNGDFVIDRHPHWRNVLIVGGGSGHGFKHGPAVGAYVAGLLAGAQVAEPRFALEAKEAVQARSVY